MAPMSRLGFATLAAIATMTTALTTRATPVEGNADWQLVWQDEFAGSAVDTTRWDVLTRQNSHNNELQYYLPEQASIVGGRLRITATNQPYLNKGYRSARLESKAAWAFGRFEVLAKVPTTKGIWPAAWLFPVDTAWPTGGEIDIMEHAGSAPTVVSSAYHWGDTPGLNATLFEKHSAVDGSGEPVVWAGGFHEYAAEWEPGRVRFFVDGVMHFEVTGAQASISSTPMNFVLNTAVGGDFDGSPDSSTVFPQHFEVEYVRVFERRPLPEPAGLAAMTGGVLLAGGRRVGRSVRG